MIWPYIAATVLFVVMLCFLAIMSRIPTPVLVVFDIAALLWLLALGGLVLGGWGA